MSQSPPLRVLLVEDEIVIGLYLKAELESIGCRVSRWVASGEAGVQAAAELKPDLVLMDIRLSGGIDGIEAARRIRKVSALPIVFVSGYQDPSIQEAAAAVGPLAYLCKPFRIGDLLPFLKGLVPGPDL